MPSFYSTTLVFSVWLFKHEDIFIIRIDFLYCQEQINVDCFSKYTTQTFYFIGNALSLRTLLNMMELFVKIGNGFSSIIDVWQGPEFAFDHDRVTFSNQTSLQNLLFSRELQQKEDMSYELTFG